MPISTRAPSNPGAAPGFLTRAAAKVAANRTALLAALRRWGIRTLAAAIVVVVAYLLFRVAVGIITTEWWFDSVHAGGVYTTELGAQVLLFAVFGTVAGVVGGLTLVGVRRGQPRLSADPDYDTFRWTFRKYEPRVWWLLLLAAALVPGVEIGRRAASYWQTYLLWRHAVPWHATDPLFHKDISFFVDVYPFHVLVVNLLLSAVTYGGWIAVIGGYWYGGWRLRRGSQKITRWFIGVLSVLAAAYLVLKAVGYWLARYSVTTSPRGPVTGASYTNVHATLPSKYVLIGFAAVCAVALVANAVRLRRTRVLVAAVVVMAVASTVAGSTWPNLVYRLREAPNAARLDLGEIANNQRATLTAFGLDGDVTTVPYHPSKAIDGASLLSLAHRTAQISLIDRNELSPTFTVKQQLQAYYGFTSTLDVSHYRIDGRSQDVVIATRGLNTADIPAASWVNQHLVYTHGYGIVAAPTTRMGRVTASPVFLDGGMPPGQQIPVSQPQIYYGKAFAASSYAIVGRPAGSHRNLEFDHPGTNGSSKAATTTYHGGGGIPLDSTLRRLLFAVRLHSSNILFSSEVNHASQLLMVRNPRARVARVAPWLTLDGDVYPAVADGRIEWVVDGYTTSSTYPDSQLVNLGGATRTTLTANGASVGQPSTNVNYMLNSVKAVVDAYTGRVTLYAWGQRQHPDPLLDAWEAAFPGLVKPQSSIPPALLRQLRYPTDLFNVQRYLLARYHVAQPANFYSGNDFWAVPNDPVAAATSRHGGAVPSEPSAYDSLSPDGFGAQHYSLSSPMVTLNGRDLAGFVYVGAEPGPDYGKFTELEFPSSAGQSPSQVQNDIESDTQITEALTLQRGGDSRVVLGDLDVIPLAGRILYVEPVYTQSRGSQSFPVLRHVIALYGNGEPSFANTLTGALKRAFASAAQKG